MIGRCAIATYITSKLRQHNDIYRQVSERKTIQLELGPITNHNIIIVPKPDQSTPTSSSEVDSDYTPATTHNTEKRTKKGEMEDVYVEWYRERLIGIISGIWPCLPCASWIGVQLEMKAAGLRNFLTCPTWWFVQFVNRLFRIRSAGVNRLPKNAKQVWKQLPNLLNLLQGRTKVKILSLHVNDELKNLRRQTCAPLANIRQKKSNRRQVVVWLAKRSQACPPPLLLINRYRPQSLNILTNSLSSRQGR